jgi:hypothetical protein
MISENTKFEIARHLDMSEQNLSGVLRGLNLDWRTTSLDDIRTAYIRDLREKAAGRGGDHQIEAAVARTRKDNAAAELLEISLLEKAGKLVPIDKIEPFITSAIVSARQAFMALPRKWSQELQAMHGINMDELYFETDINDALNQLSEADLQDSEDDDAPRDESVGSTREITDLAMGD